MAPPTGADGLLRTVAKTTSTGLCPVLVVAVVLAVSGCGGGDDSETDASAHAAQGAATEVAGKDSSPSPDSKSKRESKQQGGPESQGDPAAGAGSQAQSQGGKHGTQLVPPEGPREPAPTSQERAEATVADISLSSPAFEAGPESTVVMPTSYTCTGKDISPPLSWSGVPPGTAELILFVLNLEPVNEALFFDWALAGLDPDLQALEAGRIPKGTALGRNSFGKLGYSVCPKGPETIIFALYALPKRLSARSGFDPAALREEVLDTSSNVGILAVSYQGG